jgi:hypothetical protein
MDDRGFIRVQLEGLSEPTWLTCNQCDKSDDFVLDETAVRCKCGATYDHAMTPDGRRADLGQLAWVEWRKGPLQLAQTEIAWGRIAVIAVVLVGAIAAGLWALLS